MPTNVLETKEVQPVAEDAFDIDSFLAEEAEKDLLRFSTAGSVDDGKSTLIGRLLYDSRSVYEDQVRAVTGLQPGKQQPTIDFALLTDGLRAEREQGITIDVAYRFFSTWRRRFIIADTPGHEQYTRNMATGASTADLAIVLIDARKGILIQSRRHAYIASLLGIRNLVVAINKMDLVDFSEEVYRSIETEFVELAKEFGGANVVTIPVSALEGDNVVERSERMPWYAGPTLLEHLETVPVWTNEATQPLRIPVQRVIRPDQNFRGFAGQITGGTIRKGDEIVTLPSGRTSRVATITTYDGELQAASAPLSVVVTLEDELDISRGDLLVEPSRLPQSSTVIEASLVWFDSQRLETHRPYLLKHGAQTLPVRVSRLHHRTNIQTLAEEAVNSLGMNDIGVAEIELTRTLFFDPYAENRGSGSFILIDPHTNATLAAGMIRRGHDEVDGSFAHQPLLVKVPSHGVSDQRSDEWVVELEQRLLHAGLAVVRTQVVSAKLLHGLLSLGLVVLLEKTPETQTDDALQADGFAVVDGERFGSPAELVSELGRRGVLVPKGDEDE
jgi:sulfate adenylyltransferase subunit 1